MEQASAFNKNLKAAANGHLKSLVVSPWDTILDSQSRACFLTGKPSSRRVVFAKAY